MDTAAPPFFPARFTCTSRWNQGAQQETHSCNPAALAGAGQ